MVIYVQNGSRFIGLVFRDLPIPIVLCFILWTQIIGYVIGPVWGVIYLSTTPIFNFNLLKS